MSSSQTPFSGGRVGTPDGNFRPFISGQIELGGVPTTTPVLTPNGPVPVEFLAPGDEVVTRNCANATLQAIETDTVSEQCVGFTPGCMDRDCPPELMRLPASQPLLLRDWRAQVMFGQPQAVAPAGLLVDHGLILDLGEIELTLHRLIFERDYVIYAGGLELTSAPILERPRHRAAA